MTLGLFKDITNWTLFETDEQKRIRKNKEYENFLAKAPLARPEVVQQAEDYIKRERGKSLAEQMQGTSLFDILAGARPNLTSTVTAMPYTKEGSNYLNQLSTTQGNTNPTANNVLGNIYNLSRTGGGGFKTPEVAKEVAEAGGGNLMSMLPFLMMGGALSNTSPTITPSVATPGISITRPADAYSEYWKRKQGLV